MRYRDLKDKTPEELKEILRGLKVKTGQLRFGSGSSPQKDSSQIGKNKKDIARVMTALKALSSTGPK